MKQLHYYIRRQLCDCRLYFGSLLFKRSRKGHGRKTIGLSVSLSAENESGWTFAEKSTTFPENDIYPFQSFTDSGYNFIPELYQAPVPFRI